MPEFLEYGFMHRAFAAGAITALICPVIGVFLVPRRLSLIADSLSHVALAGVALGLLLGVSPVLGALVVTVLGAVGMERLRARRVPLGRLRAGRGTDQSGARLQRRSLRRAVRQHRDREPDGRLAHPR